MYKALLGLGVALAIAVTIVVTGDSVTSYMRQTAAVVTATLFSLTNESRGEKELYGLAENASLTAAAQAKASDMAARGYFSHATPDGEPFWVWVRDAGYEYSYAGENLAINFTESEEVIDAWLNSDSHRANVLNAKFTEIGIATATGTYKGRPTTFIVQMFGRPAHLVSLEYQEGVRDDSVAPLVIHRR
ncbi:MAG TPA: CAP domain-containing protein [Candidatus Paceibacterota bacterium]|nr:CAP domain-containing protein [Candidatus Paceibacterota bacterium]